MSNVTQSTKVSSILEEKEPIPSFLKALHSGEEQLFDPQSSSEDEIIMDLEYFS
jgi:hypothetical protein